MRRPARARGTRRHDQRSAFGPPDQGSKKGCRASPSGHGWAMGGPQMGHEPQKRRSPHLCGLRKCLIYKQNLWLRGQDLNLRPGYERCPAAPVPVGIERLDAGPTGFLPRRSLAWPALPAAAGNPHRRHSGSERLTCKMHHRRPLVSGVCRGNRHGRRREVAARAGTYLRKTVEEHPALAFRDIEHGILPHGNPSAGGVGHAWLLRAHRRCRFRSP